MHITEHIRCHQMLWRIKVLHHAQIRCTNTSKRVPNGVELTPSEPVTACLALLQNNTDMLFTGSRPCTHTPYEPHVLETYG